MFQPTHPLRDAVMAVARCSMAGALQSTHPLRDAKQIGLEHGILPVELQSTHPRGDAMRLTSFVRRKGMLQSTHPRDATKPYAKSYLQSVLQPAHLPGCDIHLEYNYSITTVSIHATLVGCDIIGRTGYRSMLSSTHVPLTEYDNTTKPCSQIRNVLQSTHPSRDAVSCESGFGKYCHALTHASLWGAIPILGLLDADYSPSIRAPLAGCDAL